MRHSGDPALQCVLSPKQIRALAVRGIAHDLTQDGFALRRGFLLREQGGPATDWIAFGTAVPDRKGPVGIWVNVGIHCAALHGRVAVLRDESRGRPAGLHGLPGRALVKAALDEPTRARRSRDRTPIRRGRIYPDDAALIRLAGSLIIEQ